MKDFLKFAYSNRMGGLQGISERA